MREYQQSLRHRRTNSSHNAIRGRCSSGTASDLRNYERQRSQRTVPTAAYDTRVRRRQPYVGRPLVGWPVAVGGEGLGVVVRLYGPELSDFGLYRA